MSNLIKIAEPVSPIKRLLLIHGVWNTRLHVWTLRKPLLKAGFECELWGYPSILGGPHAAIPKLTARLQRGDIQGIVAHSLGGVMTLKTLLQAPELPVQRVVCLGSPLRGSTVVQQLAKRKLDWIVGKSTQTLQTGLQSWQGNPEVGMVAGDKARGVGQWLAKVPAPSDGTVTLEETYLPGLTDHCIVPASHMSLLTSKAAMQQIIHFLHYGCFVNDYQ